MKKTSIMIIIFLINMMLVNVIIQETSADSGIDYPLQSTDKAIVDAYNFLENQQLESGAISGFVVSSWASMAFYLSEEHQYNLDYLVKYLRENIGLLDEKKVTDWERLTLAIVVCDENPRDFCGVDFIDQIISFYDGSQIGDEVNLYDDIFGVLVLISGEIEKDSTIIRNVINNIKEKQKDDGGWGDVDSTSVAIMALIASGENYNSEIITDALTFIKSYQTDGGGFQSWGDANAASTSWAICSIVAAGENPTSDYWMKNGKSPVDFLLSLQQQDGSFNWSINQNNNPEWMTSYVIPALMGKSYPVKISEFYNEINEWSGNIRIEGREDTIWGGIVTVGESFIEAKNVDTGEIGEYHIPYPSALGAVDIASTLGSFDYSLEYWPGWDAFLVKSIGDDSDWWHYYVDYELPMVGSDKFNLTDENNEILWGYLENWEAHALQIYVDKSEVKKNEEFIVRVFDETGQDVEDAIVFVGSNNYSTDMNGEAIISINTRGDFDVYAEKAEYIRSEKTVIKVKRSLTILKPLENTLSFYNFIFKNNLRNTIVIGGTDIEIDISGKIDRVDFYINNQRVYSDYEFPFEYELNERCFFKKMRVMVKSYVIESVN
ncbi:prenyltransferase/squalene oxidase repeat-containing protein, partial [Thermoplasmatota archaeon]